jgi:hypothetical protein
MRGWDVPSVWASADAATRYEGEERAGERRGEEKGRSGKGHITNQKETTPSTRRCDRRRAIRGERSRAGWEAGGGTHLRVWLSAAAGLTQRV